MYTIHFALLAEPLPVIYVNIWAILASLLNLLIIFFLLKKFLFRPVTRVVSQREEMIASSIADADAAKADAERDRDALAVRLAGAEEEAAEVIRRATVNATRTGEEIIADARERAADIKQAAEEDIAQEKKRALNEIKGEVSDLSLTIAEVVVGREINEEDHRTLIDNFISEVGDDHD